MRKATRAERRPELARALPCALWTLLLLSAGCVWPSPERQLLLDFFHACRLYDVTVLERLSTVPCNPRTDGVVDQFDLVDVEPLTPSERRVSIHAQVRMFDGSLASHAMTITLARREQRWMVTAITPPLASQTSPAASSAPPN